jgi:hypothetical protein
VASAIAIFEQLLDVFRANVETIVSLSAPQTPQWVQDRVFKFQYSATTPQIIQLIDLIPQYTLVDEELKIITRCSVKTALAGRVNVKVAKEEPPTPLDSLELSALQSYVTTIGVAGIDYIVTSTDSDKLSIEADIFYNGSYSSVISDNVIASVTTFLSTIPFDGSLKLIDLEIAIRNTAGVNDVLFHNILARKDSVPIAGATYLIQNNTVLSRQWPTISGYIVPETTSGSTLADTLNFIAE